MDCSCNCDFNPGQANLSRGSPLYWFALILPAPFGPSHSSSNTSSKGPSGQGSLHRARTSDTVMLTKPCHKSSFPGTHRRTTVREGAPFHYSQSVLRRTSSEQDGFKGTVCCAPCLKESAGFAPCHRTELQEEWPSVFKEDESFWAHEWSKHGTCALDIFPSELDYFKGTLDLHAKYDLQVRNHRTTFVTLGLQQEQHRMCSAVLSSAPEHVRGCGFVVCSERPSSMSARSGCSRSGHLEAADAHHRVMWSSPSPACRLS